MTGRLHVSQGHRPPPPATIMDTETNIVQHLDSFSGRFISVDCSRVGASSQFDTFAVGARARTRPQERVGRGIQPAAGRA